MSRPARMRRGGWVNERWRHRAAQVTRAADLARALSDYDGCRFQWMSPKVKNSPSDDLENPGTVVEYGLLMSGGGYQIRNGHPEIERIYPVTEWIADETRNGSHVFRRRVIVVEEWAEVTS
jgi:hypothetical protein